MSYFEKFLSFGSSIQKEIENISILTAANSRIRSL